MNNDEETRIISPLKSDHAWVEYYLRPVLAIVALLLFAVAIIFGLKENVAGLAAAAAPALFCLVFVFLNRFSEIAVLGFKAKILDQKIVEANNIIDQLKSLTVVSARAAYLTLIYGNRMTDIPLREKQGLVDEMDGMLRELSLDHSLLQSERDKFLDMHKFDIALFVERVLSQRLNDLRHKASVAQSQGNPSATDWKNLVASIQKALRDVDVQDVSKKGQAKQFFSSLKAGIEEADFRPDPIEKQILSKLIDEAVSLCNGIQSKNGITDEARAYLESSTQADAAKRKLEQLGVSHDS